jgi:hypothetical protein
MCVSAAIRPNMPRTVSETEVGPFSSKRVVDSLLENYLVFCTLMDRGHNQSTTAFSIRVMTRGG